MGGRVAEEIVFHDPSTGASNDIEKATATARAMVTDYGMSERIGAVKLGSSSGDAMYGQAASRNYSDAMANVVDEEVRTLIDAAHDDAYAALTENRHVLDRLALALLEHETLNQKEIEEIFHDLIKRPEREVWLSKDSRPVHTAGPVLSPKEAASQQQAPATGETAGE
jgi:cell division protease FtsH